MSVSVSKVNYGVIVGPASGVSVSKINFGIIVGPDAAPETDRRRQAMVGSF